MERGNQRFRCDGFPSPLDPHPFLSPTRGHPWTPKSFLCNSLVQSCKKCSFLRLSAGFRFGTRRAVSGFGLGLLVRQGFLGAKAGFGGLGLRFLIRNGFLGAKAGFGGFGL